MSTISQEESLLLQCLATTSLLGELSNANFLEAITISNCHFQIRTESVKYFV